MDTVGAVVVGDGGAGVEAARPVLVAEEPELSDERTSLSPPAIVRPLLCLKRPIKSWVRETLCRTWDEQERP